MKTDGREYTGVIETDSAEADGISSLFNLRQVFGFFTILPVTRGRLSDAADAIWMLPLAAATLGVAEGLAAWGLSFFFGPLVTAAIVLALALVLTGFHHVDGLADTGDAIMARGNAARRLEVLKDRTLGVGGVGTMVLTYLISWSALAETAAKLSGSKIILTLVAVEVSARLSLLLVGRMTPPSHEGSGSIFIKALGGWRGAAGIALSLAVLLAAAPVIPWTSLFTGSAAVVTAAAVSLIARRWFGGAGGDILGTSVEWGRMAALLAVVASLQIM